MCVFTGCGLGWQEIFELFCHNCLTQTLDPSENSQHQVLKAQQIVTTHGHSQLSMHNDQPTLSANRPSSKQWPSSSMVLPCQ